VKLELRLRDVFRQLYDQQVAFVFKVPEALQQTPCDFFGHTRAGRAILIEAKQVKRSCLPVGGSPGLAPHQWLALRQASACGAHSFVVWQNGDLIVPMDFASAATASSGRKSIPWEWAKNMACDPLRWFEDRLRS
jgi:hypothetical protein